MQPGSCSRCYCRAQEPPDSSGNTYIFVLDFPRDPLQELVEMPSPLR